MAWGGAETSARFWGHICWFDLLELLFFLRFWGVYQVYLFALWCCIRVTLRSWVGQESPIGAGSFRCPWPRSTDASLSRHMVRSFTCPGLVASSDHEVKLHVKPILQGVQYCQLVLPHISRGVAPGCFHTLPGQCCKKVL